MRFIKKYTDYIIEQLQTKINDVEDTDTELVDDKIDLKTGNKIVTVDNWKVY